ncbi:MAG: hypothetical protein JKY70_15400 [Mucilaginibacter sp.]|nr:hypothetical protein [Mucilaginibacter sp.]
MRFVIIFLLSLCHFVTKAHDHTGEAKNSHINRYARFDGSNQRDSFIFSEDIGDQSEVVVAIDDDDNDDLVSARKHTLLAKSAIVQFYLKLLSGLYPSTHKGWLSYSQSLIIPTDRYITQRVLRI